MNRLFLTILSVCFLHGGFAQAPNVTAHFPVNLENSAPAQEKITADFDTPLDAATVHSGTVKVFGRWSGPLAAAVQLTNGGQRVEIVPAEPFIAGEWVTVNLTRDIQSAGGEAMGRGYSWNFWVATAESSLQQSPVDTIVLRLPGEEYLQTYGAYAGDINNDGFSDLVVVNEFVDDLRILLNDGAGNYTDFTVIPMGNLLPSPNEGADFDNDGEIDLAVSTAHQNEVRVLFGDGQGGFTPPEVYYTDAGARGLVVLDCNGDGHDDIFITNRIAGNLSLLVNDGTGQFTVEPMDTDGSAETSCAVADANNDGFPDIFIGMFTNPELALLLGDGQGGFTLSDRVSVTGSPWMIATADLNGDGFADVASANSNGNRMAVAFGDGAGQLSEPTHYTHSTLRFPLAIDLGDLDGDGDIDIVTSNYSGPTFAVFENDGAGNFSVASILPSPDLASCAILHDRDNDGDIDISGTDEGVDEIVLFENPGMVNAVRDGGEAKLSAELLSNPCREDCGLALDLEEAAEVRLSIFNAQGQAIDHRNFGRLPAGEHRLSWPVGGLAAGAYFLKLEAGEKQWAERLVVGD